MKHRTIILLLIALTLPFSTVSILAEEDMYNLTEPKQPNVENLSPAEANALIEDYNKAVDEYNEKASAYNAEIDAQIAKIDEHNNLEAQHEEANKIIEVENQAELERVQALQDEEDARVAEASEHNAQENAKVAEIEEYNLSETTRVEELNQQRIDEENARVESAIAHNAEEDAKVAQNEADLQQYEANMAKYETDLAQYEKDKQTEQKILNAGYESVEQYNQMINDKYNTPAQTSVEKNNAAITVDVKDTYAVEEATEKSGQEVSVHIYHIFEGINVIYKDEFIIDRNDIITFSSIAALVEQTNPGWASFYYNTDSNHSMGYWYETWSDFETNSVYSDSNWNAGDIHIASFKDGALYDAENAEIYMTYNYGWMPLKTYKTYNVPTEPAAPEIVEKYVPTYENTEWSVELEEPILKEYTPEYKDTTRTIFEPTLKELNTIEYIKNYPSKIGLLSRMALLSVPTPAPVADPIVPIEPSRPATPTAAPVESKPEPEVELIIAEEPVVEVKIEEPVTIINEEVPLANLGTWALVNLITTIITIINALGMIVTALFKKSYEDDDKDGYHKKSKLFGLLPAILSVMLFILTEDMTLPMTIVDKWTLPMALVLLTSAVLVYLTKNKKYEEQEEE